MSTDAGCQEGYHQGQHQTAGEHYPGRTLFQPPDFGYTDAPASVNSCRQLIKVMNASTGKHMIVPTCTNTYKDPDELLIHKISLCQSVLALSQNDRNRTLISNATGTLNCKIDERTPLAEQHFQPGGHLWATSYITRLGLNRRKWLHLFRNICLQTSYTRSDKLNNKSIKKRYLLSACQGFAKSENEVFRLNFQQEESIAPA